MLSVQPLAGEARSEVVVVGAGIAGISCAYHLEKAGFQVTVVEEQQVASGATNYSSGVLYFGSGTGFASAIELFGKDKAKQLWDESKAAIDDLASLAKGISAAGLRDTGLTLVARNEQEQKDIETEATAMNSLGYPGKAVSSQELSSWFKPRQFLSGLYQPVCFQIKPPFFAKGIASQLQSNIYENSAMTEIVESENESEVVVKTSGGLLRCQQVVVATNIKPFYGLEEHFFMEDSVDLPSQEMLEGKLIEIIQ